MNDGVASQPWYGDGLRFECTRCGNCCTGSPGTVLVNDEEIAALAVRLELGDEEFRSRYTRVLYDGTVSLQEKPDYDCVFYSRSEGCLVYEDRPRQCRTWPFWGSNLETSASWAREATGCPGMNRGRLYTLEEIEETIADDGTAATPGPRRAARSSDSSR